MSTQDIDAATVEVVRNYLTSAATEMQRTLIRTAYNTIIYEILDFGISVFDRDLNLIADSPGLALFLGANDYGIEKAVEHVGEENMDPGDVFIMNYPYWSGTHTLDVLLFAPVFHDEELIGYTTCRAHWLDLGAKDSGYVLDSTDVHQEGVLFPGTKVYKGGEPDPEIMDIIRFNSRMPEKVVGDLNAQVAAVRTGEQRLQELYEKYGADTVETAVDVDNPLLGERGASAVFGPQKGATPDDVAALDAALARFADVAAKALGTDHRELAGAGAAGGMGFAARAFLGAELRPGIELVMTQAGFGALLAEADLVITGEGQLDGQSMAGKTPVGVAREAKRQGVPVVVLAGRLAPGWQAAFDEGVSAAFALADGPMALDEALERCAELLADRAESLARLLTVTVPRGSS
jgi:hypothetical protein